MISINISIKILITKETLHFVEAVLQNDDQNCALQR